MTRKVLLSGIILLLFYEAIIWFLMPSGRIPEWIDFRVTKEYTAVGLALFLTAFIWVDVGKLICPNKWALFFLIFLFFNLSKTPLIGVGNEGIEVGLLGNFSAEFKIFAFFLMFCAISSAKFSQELIDEILLTILISGIVMGFYMIVQSMNIDQIFRPKPEYFNTYVKGIRVAGTFGQPTLVVPFLAMCIPIAVYFGNPLAIPPILAAMILTGSDFTYLSVLFLGLLYSMRTRIFPFLLTASVIAIPILMYFTPYRFFTDNGRFNAWGYLLKDVFSGEINGLPIRIGLFGAGFNNFGLFRSFHDSAFMHAHNEYLQVLWCGGVVGLLIFLMIHFDVFKTVLKFLRGK